MNIGSDAVLVSRELLDGLAAHKSVSTPHDLTRVFSSKGSFIPDRLYNPCRILFRQLSYMVKHKMSPYEIYDTEKLIFIHIPKNAGKFINELIYSSQRPEDSAAAIAHHSARYLKALSQRKFLGFPKFAILRHPSSRLKSAFNYLKFQSTFETDRAFADEHLNDYADFKSFCCKIPENQFQKLLDWPHFQPQTSFVCDVSGTLMVDVLITFEDLHNGLPKVGQYFGKDWCNSKVKKMPLPSINQDSSSRLIHSYYAEDLYLWDAVSRSDGKFTIVK